MSHQSTLDSVEDIPSTAKSTRSFNSADSGEHKTKKRVQAAGVVGSFTDVDELLAQGGRALRELAGTSMGLYDEFTVLLRNRYKALSFGPRLSLRDAQRALGKRPSPVQVARALPTTLPPLTQFGVAMRLLDQRGDEVKYVLGEKRWLRWSGVRWEAALDEQMQAMVKVIVEQQLPAEASLFEDADAQEKYRLKAEAMGHSSNVSGAVAALKATESLHVAAEDLDRRPDYLTVANGAVKLSGEGAGSLVVDKDLLLTIENNTNFNPEAKCPLFMKVLNDTFEGRGEDVRYYELIMGYTVMSNPAERAMFFHIGEGNNGKSLQLGAICHALGQSHAPVINYRLIASEPGAMVGGDANSASPAQYKLRSARLGYIDELPKGGVMRDAAVKLFAGGSRIDARLLGQGLVEFDMSAVLHINCNAQVAIRGAQRSTWHRVCPVAYRASFKDDPTLPGKLKQEAEGILAWLVGCAKKYEDIRAKGEGLRDHMPVSAREELAAMQKQQDPLAEWIEDCCVLEEGAGMHSVEGWKAFQDYHQNRHSDLSGSVRTDKLWGERMLSVQGVKDAKGNLVLANVDPRVEAKRVRGFYGIRLKDSPWYSKSGGRPKSMNAEQKELSL